MLERKESPLVGGKVWNPSCPKYIFIGKKQCLMSSVKRITSILAFNQNHSVVLPRCNYSDIFESLPATFLTGIRDSVFSTLRRVGVIRDLGRCRDLERLRTTDQRKVEQKEKRVLQKKKDTDHKSAANGWDVTWIVFAIFLLQEMIFRRRGLTPDEQFLENKNAFKPTTKMHQLRKLVFKDKNNCFFKILR